MSDNLSRPSLSELLPPLILGGAGFSNQCHPNPNSLPVSSIVKQAFQHGIRCIDTSPYYEPSEQLLGEALSSPEVADCFPRADILLMTKVGRIAAEHWDYSPAFIKSSVEQSLKRLRTNYLDVVFCHDVEAVTDEDVLGAIGVLIDFVRQGKVRYIGISGYPIGVLGHLARLVHERFGRPLDVIQSWGQLTLQNSRLESEGLQTFRKAGVSCVCNSSPLCIGLLREGGVPVGKLGDFHPAPLGLKKVAQDAANFLKSHGESLATLALRYSLWRANANSDDSFRVCTITGISTVPQLMDNVTTAKLILKPNIGAYNGLAGSIVDDEQLKRDRPIFEKVQNILGAWMDYTFTVPAKGWSRELKCMLSEDIED